MEPGRSVSESRADEIARMVRDRSRLNPKRESNAVYLVFGQHVIDRLSRTWLKGHSEFFAEYFTGMEPLCTRFQLPFGLASRTCLRIFDHDLVAMPFLGKLEAMIFYTLYGFNDLSQRCDELVLWQDTKY